MAVTRDTRTIWRTDLDPEFEGESEAHARARDRMLAARAFTEADVGEHRRFRNPDAEAAEVDRMLAFVERYERQRDPFDEAGAGGPLADVDPDETIGAGGQSFP